MPTPAVEWPLSVSTARVCDGALLLSNAAGRAPQATLV